MRELKGLKGMLYIFCQQKRFMRKLIINFNLTCLIKVLPSDQVFTLYIKSKFFKSAKIHRSDIESIYWSIGCEFIRLVFKSVPNIFQDLLFCSAKVC